MNTVSRSRAEAARPGAAPGSTALVWDLPVRVFHWLMVLCFAGAYLSAESERWRLLHVTLGYTMGGLVGFRLVWGAVGTRHARFSNFVRGPRAVKDYVLSLLCRQPEHHLGHNPAGAAAILALLALTVAVGLTGYANYDEWGPSWWREAHEPVAELMLAVVGLHLAGVLISSWLHRDNLVRAMLTGRKPGRPQEGARSAWVSVGVLLLAAVLGFWWLQWRGAPPADSAGRAADAPVASSRGVDRD